ncbi:hypothetical protein RhiLY_10033 [Ceratobasidium sp. AG-Ba]|nr:hypothetical protein RhiLY_10033 [Ceratobasidium sp. AG-Ba]
MVAPEGARGLSLQFHDLDHLKLKVGCDDFDVNGSHIQAIASSLHFSPKLRTLELEILSSWSLRALCAGLKTMTFPCLHTIRAQGHLQDDWRSLSEYGDDALYAFLARHPGLQVVQFDRGYDSTRGCPSDALAVVFPSLRALEAPPDFCYALAMSHKNCQIRSLSVAYLREAEAALIRDTLPCLPILQRLNITDYYDRKRSIIKNVITCGCESLEELQVGTESMFSAKPSRIDLRPCLSRIASPEIWTKRMA